MVPLFNFCNLAGDFLKYNWQPLLGKFEQEDATDKNIFKGELIEYQGKTFAGIGQIMCNQMFSGGSITADIQFTEIDQDSSCEIILNFNPVTGAKVVAGLGAGTLFVIRSFDPFQNKWQTHAIAGDRANLRGNQTYQVKVDLSGSWVGLTVDGVIVLTANVPLSISRTQVGIFTQGLHDVLISNFEVGPQANPRAFVIMPFSEPYNALHEHVITKVCASLGIEAVRADDRYGPGLIIGDIIQEINRSTLVIAEITSRNANVFYEVGFSHAVNKQTILIAEKETELPFDVSPFRTLFYENTIAGKAKLEEGLQKHLRAILGLLPT